jgi:hypothetical protein
MASDRQTSLEYSLCQYPVATGRPIIVGDARDDPVLAANRAVADLGVRAYAGIPMVDWHGQAFGTFCVIGVAVRDWNDAQLAMLARLADIAPEICVGDQRARGFEEAGHVAQNRPIPAWAWLNALAHRPADEIGDLIGVACEQPEDRWADALVDIALDLAHLAAGQAASIQTDLFVPAELEALAGRHPPDGPGHLVRAVRRRQAIDRRRAVTNPPNHPTNPPLHPPPRRWRSRILGARAGRSQR